MDETKTAAILSALAHGVNPSTGEVFGPDSPYQQADVVRALFAALDRFRQIDSPRRKVSPGVNPGVNPGVSPGVNPGAANESRSNVGKPWGDDEDRRLLAEFDRGRKPAELARDFGRTVAGIEARLERHGRISAAERTTANRYPKQRPTDSPAGIG